MSAGAPAFVYTTQRRGRSHAARRPSSAALLGPGSHRALWWWPTCTWKRQLLCRARQLPPYDTRESLGRLAAEVEALGPAVVILLGDTFHDRTSEARLAADDAERLRGLARGRTLIWVVGNHDADGPAALPGKVADELELSGLTLRHEPRAGLQPGEVCGHLHPAARVKAARGSVRRRCFVTDSERAILPAFGA